MYKNLKFYFAGFSPVLFVLINICQMNSSTAALNPNATTTVSIGGNNYSIKYDSSCDLLNSTNVDNGIKCVLLCQTTQCKSLSYDSWSSTCVLNGSNPNLINYDQLPDLSIIYFLGNLRLISSSYTQYNIERKIKITQIV